MAYAHSTQLMVSETVIFSVTETIKRQTGQANAITENSSTEDYYRINIAIPFVDHIVQEIVSSRLFQYIEKLASACDDLVTY